MRTVVRKDLAHVKRLLFEGLLEFYLNLYQKLDWGVPEESSDERWKDGVR